MSKKKISRRSFIKKAGESSGAILVSSILNKEVSKGHAHSDDVSHIYHAGNNGPIQNMENVIQMMGGIQNLIGINDIVVIKTNAQWWNQGSPNLAATKRFIELILNIPGYVGEIIICDNNHRSYPTTRGAWAEEFKINSDVPGVKNLMDLINWFQNQGYNNVTHYCWNDVKDYGGTRTSGPAEGDGYVYLPEIKYDNGASGDNHRVTIMSYPVFTSSHSGVTIDLKKGAWKDGHYTGQPVKFIVFSALCDHYTAKVTSAIKNLFGVVDLSGGSNPFVNGLMLDNYYNFHSFSYNKDDPGPVPGAMGGAVGTLLNCIRTDLFITTAEWVGVSDRKDTGSAEQTGVILASTDPVALDYYSTKYILYPAGKKRNYNKAEQFNPDNKDLQLRQYLEKCHEQGIGNIDENKIIVHTPQTPVNIITFNARIVDQHVELFWEVEQAEKFFGFEIQKSYNNSDFFKIGFIEFHEKDKHFSYLDKSDNWGRLNYRLKLIDRNGKFNYSDTITIDITSAKSFTLYQNYPNPFNSETVIRFLITQNEQVSLQIFDITGRNVKLLISEYKHAGNYSIKWDGTDNFGNKVASGIYIYQLKMNKQILTKKMFLSN